VISDSAITRPRILFVSHTAEWTGPTNSLLLLLENLRSRFDQSVLLPGEGLFAERLAEQGVRFFSFPSLRKWKVPAMVRLIRQNRIDLVYGNNTGSACKNALIAAKIAGVPFIYHIRAMAGTEGWRKVRLLRFADATIAVSAACARSFSRFLGRRLPYVVHNGVTLRPTSPDRAAARRRLSEVAGIPADATVMVAVGNVDRRKATEYSVRATVRIVREVPSTFLLVIGRLDRDPEYVRRIRCLVRDLELEGHVRILDFRADVLDLLEGCDLLLHTARDDPHPRVVIEAMAAGLPVVAFPIDGVAETVVDGETGYLAPAGNVTALAEAALQLVRDPALRAEFGKRARSRAAEHYSAQATAGKVGDIIDHTLRRAPPRLQPARPVATCTS
jgi:glycosyltransferase involved in cell wall biosynthesis